MSSGTNWIGILMLGSLGAALVSFSKISPKPNRLVVKWRKNPDETCTYTYDDGSEETGVCTEPPS